VRNFPSGYVWGSLGFLLNRHKFGGLNEAGLEPDVGARRSEGNDSG